MKKISNCLNEQISATLLDLFPMLKSFDTNLLSSNPFHKINHGYDQVL